MKRFLLFLSLCMGGVTASTAVADGHGDHASKTIDQVLAEQTDEIKARYDARNPKETLEFFGIRPGDRVFEAGPGGGWYSRILTSYLGEEGTLLAVDYDPAIFDYWNVSDEFRENRKTWTETFPLKKEEWGIEGGAEIIGARFGAIPDSLNGTMDSALFIRAIHGFARHEDKGQFLSNALADSFTALKSGGTLGIVQHAAREDRSDEWASGSAGYLKASYVIKMASDAGFEFVESSNINANEKDQAREGDVVWRLPPSMNVDGVDKDAMKAIGESNRMTLKFKKP